MTQIVTNNENNIKKYLITEAVDIKQLSQQKLSNDLDILKKQEAKTNMKTDISRKTRHLNLSRIMQALQLNNPFRGY
jgi:hypothetical protein